MLGGGNTVKLLIIDSDRDMVEMLTSLLKTYGYEVHRAYDGERARAEWIKHEPDLVIMDSTLADADPAAICRDMQAQHDALVLVLAERADAQTQVRYLDAGADAFLPKPFLPSHLLAYIRAIMRRVRNTLKTRPQSLVEVGPIRVDSQRNQAFVNGKIVHLTPIETKLLHLLAINAREVCTASQIVEHVWGYDDFGEAELIKAHIRHLRQKIEPDPSNPRYILNVPGVGYTLAVQGGEEAGGAAVGARLETTPPGRGTGAFVMPRFSHEPAH
ncbi:MAG TPA: response regulator transcription factor [Ktedonobacterales bacterium]|nr:response regulator transcription factor [Ktedonobacterales bacterium]